MFFGIIHTVHAWYYMYRPDVICDKAERCTVDCTVRVADLSAELVVCETDRLWDRRCRGALALKARPSVTHVGVRCATYTSGSLQFTIVRFRGRSNVLTLRDALNQMPHDYPVQPGTTQGRHCAVFPCLRTGRALKYARPKYLITQVRLELAVIPCIRSRTRLERHD